MFIEDLAPHPAVKLKSVGYLDGDFVVGVVPSDFVGRLRELKAESVMPGFGKHVCPYCGGAESGYEFISGGYVWPEMLPHYVEVHGYRPPQEFIDFVMAWVPTEDDEKQETPIKLPDFDF